MLFIGVCVCEGEMGGGCFVVIYCEKQPLSVKIPADRIVTLPLTLHPFPSRLFGSGCLTDSGDQHRQPDAAEHGLDAWVWAGGRRGRAPRPCGGLQEAWPQRLGLRDAVRHLSCRGFCGVH